MAGAQDATPFSQRSARSHIFTLLSRHSPIPSDSQKRPSQPQRYPKVHQHRRFVMATVMAAIARSKAKWEDMGPRIWFLGSSPRYLDLQGNVVAMSALPLMRKKDSIILPGNNDATRDFIDFCRELLAIEDHQIFYTDEPNTFLTDNDDAHVSDLIRKILEEGPQNEGEKFMLVPPKVTSNMKKWLNPLHERGLLVFGDDDPALRHCSSAILHRSVKKIDEPSLVEKECPDIKVTAGYVCGNVSELLLAYSRLEVEIDRNAWDGRVVIRPLRSARGDGSVVVGSEQELRMYDFPFGNVCLEELPKLDMQPDTPVVTTCVAFVQRKRLRTVDVTRIDAGKLTIRYSRRDDEFTTTANAWADELIEKSRINANGAGVFEFGSVDGKPILLSVATGISNEHFPLIFADRYAPEGSVILFWDFTPNISLDVWTCWYRFYDNGIAFRPGKKRSTSGVFPLSYQKGERSSFIAIGADDAAVEKLRVTAEQVLREPISDEPLARVGLEEDVRHIWCGSARPEYRRETQRYNLPNRCIPLIRPQKDIIILPGNHEPTREFWEHCRDTLGLDEDQAIFTSNEHFVLDDDVDDNIVTRIKALVATHPKDRFTLVPYCVTANFERWANQLRDVGVTVFGESLDWVETYGHKGILHRHMAHLDKPCIIEQIAPNVRVAKGYTCSTSEELLKAYEMLEMRDVVIKPVFGAAGEGIVFVSDVETIKRYDFPMGDVILEEFLNLDRTQDGIVLSPAVHYMKNAPFGEGLVDQIMVGTGYAGWRRSVATKLFQQTCSRAVAKILKGVKPQGPGGVDFLSVEGLPFLTDVNTGRFNGAHFPKMFVERYARGSAFYCWKFKPPPNLTVEILWGRLQSAKLAFEPGVSDTGVFPLVFLRGLSGLYIAIAKTDRECVQLYESAKPCLEERIPLKSALPALTRPATSTVKMTLIKDVEAIYGPQPIPYHHILIGGQHVIGLLDDVAARSMEDVVRSSGGTVVDGTGCIATPGIVDIHVHVTGGGGEMGPASRTPEATLSSLVEAGITTVIGVTGTDSVSRSMENLLTKVRALEQEGLSAFMWSGAYRVPTPTITGSVMRDVCLIEQCIGVGEIAIADHRGSQPTNHDLETLGSECRVGGLLANKAGVVYCHMGTGKTMLEDLRKAVRGSDLPISTFLPTHMSRTKALAEDGAKWIKEGGYVDFTARSSSTIRAVTNYYARGVNLDHVMISSDGFGSSPTYDEKGELLRYRALSPSCMLELLRDLHFKLQWPIQRVLPFITKNPAEFLKLKGKGSIQVGYDADILLLDINDLESKYVFAKGNILKSPEYIKKGMFED